MPIDDWCQSKSMSKTNRSISHLFFSIFFLFQNWCDREFVSQVNDVRSIIDIDERHDKSLQRTVQYDIHSLQVEQMMKKKQGYDKERRERRGEERRERRGDIFRIFISTRWSMKKSFERNHVRQNTANFYSLLRSSSLSSSKSKSNEFVESIEMFNQFKTKLSTDFKRFWWFSSISNTYSNKSHCDDRCRNNSTKINDDRRRSIDNRWSFGQSTIETAF